MLISDSRYHFLPRFDSLVLQLHTFARIESFDCSCGRIYNPSEHVNTTPPCHVRNGDSLSTLLLKQVSIVCAGGLPDELEPGQEVICESSPDYTIAQVGTPLRFRDSVVFR